MRSESCELCRCQRGRWAGTRNTTPTHLLEIPPINQVISLIDGWPWKTIRHLFYATSSIVQKIISQPSMNSNSINSPETPNLGQNRWFLALCDLENLMDGLEKHQGTPSMLLQALCIISQPSMNSNSINSPETPNLGKNRRLLVPRDLEIWRMTLKNNRTPLLCYLKHCASFQNHRWIQTPLTVRKRPIWVKIDNFWSRVSLKFDGWPWKTIGHLFYATSSIVHHFTAIGELKLH